MRRFVVMTLLLAVAGQGWAEEDCSTVVDATVAEMSVSVGANWSPATEQIVRMAAGSACVKARSGRYGAATSTVIEKEIVSESGLVEETVEEKVATESEKAAADDDSFEAGGITFRPMSGSPGKKPYERNRNKDD